MRSSGWHMPGTWELDEINQINHDLNWNFKSILHSLLSVHRWARNGNRKMYRSFFSGPPEKRRLCFITPQGIFKFFHTLCHHENICRLDEPPIVLTTVDDWYILTSSYLVKLASLVATFTISTLSWILYNGRACCLHRHHGNPADRARM